MAVSQAVQANLDAVRQTQSLVKSVEAGLAVQNQMIADQGMKIAALQAQIDAGGAPLGADDLAALAETNTDLAAVNTSLQADIPANTTTTSPAPAPAPVAAPAPATSTAS